MSLTAAGGELRTAGGDLQDAVAARLGEATQGGIDAIRVTQLIAGKANVLLGPVKHRGVDLGSCEGHGGSFWRSCVDRLPTPQYVKNRGAAAGQGRARPSDGEHHPVAGLAGLARRARGVTDDRPARRDQVEWGPGVSGHDVRGSPRRRRPDRFRGDSARGDGDADVLALRRRGCDFGERQRLARRRVRLGALACQTLSARRRSTQGKGAKPGRWRRSAQKSTPWEGDDPTDRVFSRRRGAATAGNLKATPVSWSAMTTTTLAADAGLLGSGDAHRLLRCVGDGGPAGRRLRRVGRAVPGAAR